MFSLAARNRSAHLRRASQSKYKRGLGMVDSIVALQATVNGIVTGSSVAVNTLVATIS